MPPSPKERALWALFLLCLYVAVSALGWHHTLIYDEIWYLLNAVRPLEEQMGTLQRDLVHPPLMYVLERFWMQAFGYTDNAVKVLVLVINALSIAAFTALAAMVSSRWRMTSFLFCTAYLQLGGVPNLVRGYSLGLLLTVIALFAWERWRRGAGPSMLALWAAAMLFLIYTHCTGLLLLGSFVLANWLSGKRRWAFTAISCALALAFLPWALFVLPSALSIGVQGIGWIEKNPWWAAAKLPFHFLSYLPSGANPLGENDWPASALIRHALVGLALVVHALLVVLAGRRLASCWPPRLNRTITASSLWSSALLVICPILALLAFSLIVRPALDARFVSFVLPMYWILMMALVELGGGPSRLLLYAVVVPWLVTSVAVPLVRSQRPGLRQSLTVVEQLMQPSDVILVDRLAGPLVYWNWVHALSRKEPISIIPARAEDPPALPVKGFNQLDLSHVRRVWLFTTPYNPIGVGAIRNHLSERGFHELREPLWRRQPFLSVFDR